MARCRATRTAFEAEVRARNEREEAAGQKLEELLKNLDLKIDGEIAARHQQVASIKRDVGLLLRCNFTPPFKLTDTSISTHQEMILPSLRNFNL